MGIRIVFAAFAVLWVALALAPVSRSDWMLENVMTLVGVGLLVAFWRARTLSQTSVALALVFLALHAIGAHYTYSLVPYDDWSRSLFGRSITDVTGARATNTIGSCIFRSVCCWRFRVTNGSCAAARHRTARRGG